MSTNQYKVQMNNSGNSDQQINIPIQIFNNFSASPASEPQALQTTIQQVDDSEDEGTEQVSDVKVLCDLFANQSQIIKVQSFNRTQDNSLTRTIELTTDLVQEVLAKLQSLRSNEESKTPVQEIATKIVPQPISIFANIDHMFEADQEKKLKEKQEKLKQQQQEAKQTPNVTQRESFQSKRNSNEPSLIEGSDAALRKTQSVMPSDTRRLQDENERLKKEVFELRTQISGQTTTLISDSTPSSTEVHVAFTFASPLLQYLGQNKNGEKKVIIFDQLQHEKEFSYIDEAAKNSGKQVRLLKAPANRKSFEELLLEKPRGLHFFGHGVKNSKEAFGESFYNVHKCDGDSLLFELKQGTGEVDYLSRKELKGYLAKFHDTNFDFVFVASCHSEFAGKIFSEAGAKHVICIRYEQQVAENSVLTFTKTFYQQLFKNNSVCASFDCAVASVGFKTPQKHQHDIQVKNEKAYEQLQFKLLLPNGKIKLPGQNCTSEGCLSSYQYIRPGKYQKLNKNAKDGSVSLPIFPSLFQNKELQTNRIQATDLLKLLLVKKMRLVVVTGVPGVGKSTLVQYVMHFCNQRDQFLAGMAFLSVKKVRSLNGLKQILFNHLINSDNATESDQNLKDSRGNVDEEQLIKALSKSKQDKKHRMLICFDNADDLLEHNWFELKSFLDKIQNDSRLNIQVVLTSRPQNCFLSDVVTNKREGFFEVEPLRDFEAVSLFLKSTQDPIKEEEALQFFEKTPEYPFESLGFTKDQLIPSELKTTNLKPDLQLKFINRLKNEKDFIQKCFAAHELFRLLGGNPSSITLIASMKSKKASLMSIYRSFKGHKMDEQMKAEGVSEPYEVSLRLSHWVIVKFLEDSKDEKSLRILFFIGILPGGVSEDLLNAVENDWQHSISILNQYQLFEHKEKGENYVLKTSMMDYIRSTIQDKDKQQFLERIFSYYSALLKNKYEQLYKDKYETRIGSPDKFPVSSHEFRNIIYCIEKISDQEKPQKQCQKLSRDKLVKSEVKEAPRFLTPTPSPTQTLNQTINSEVQMQQDSKSSEEEQNTSSDSEDNNSEDSNGLGGREVNDLGGVGHQSTIESNSVSRSSMGRGAFGINNSFDQEIGSYDDDAMYSQFFDTRTKSQFNQERTRSSIQVKARRPSLPQNRLFPSQATTPTNAPKFGNEGQNSQERPSLLRPDRQNALFKSSQRPITYSRPTTDEDQKDGTNDGKTNKTSNSKLSTNIINMIYRKTKTSTSYKKHSLTLESMAEFQSSRATNLSFSFAPEHLENLNSQRDPNQSFAETANLVDKILPKNSLILYFTSIQLMVGDLTQCDQPLLQTMDGSYLFLANCHKLKATYLERASIGSSMSIKHAVRELQHATEAFGLYNFIKDYLEQAEKEENPFVRVSSDPKYCVEGIALTALQLGYFQQRHIYSSKLVLKEIEDEGVLFPSVLCCQNALETAYNAFVKLHDHQGMYISAKLIHDHLNTLMETSLKQKKNKIKKSADLYRQLSRKHKKYAEDLLPEGQTLLCKEELLESIFMKLVLTESKEKVENCKCEDFKEESDNEHKSQQHFSGPLNRMALSHQISFTAGMSSSRLFNSNMSSMSHNLLGQSLTASHKAVTRKDPKEEFFKLSLISFKLNNAHNPKYMKADPDQLYNEVKDQNIHFHQWQTWIFNRLTKSAQEAKNEARKKALLDKKRAEDHEKCTLFDEFSLYVQNENYWAKESHHQMSFHKQSF